MKDISKEIKKILCPNCGKELIALEPIENNELDFWCDDCLIDIHMENSCRAIELDSETNSKLIDCIAKEAEIRSRVKYNSIHQALEEERIAFGGYMQEITIGFINENGDDDSVAFDVKSEEELCELFKVFLNETYKNEYSYDKITFAELDFTCDQSMRINKINNLIRTLTRELINCPNPKDSYETIPLLSDDYLRNVIDKFSSIMNNLKINNRPINYPIIVSEDLYDNGKKYEYVKELTPIGESVLDEEGDVL